MACTDEADQPCTRCSPYSTSPARHGEPCELPLMKSFGGTYFHGRWGRFAYISHLCFMVSAQHSTCGTPALRYWEWLWPCGQLLLPLAGPPSPSVSQHFGLILPYPYPCPSLQAVHTWPQGSRFQKAKAGANIKQVFFYFFHTEHNKTPSKAGFRPSSPSSNIAINQVSN